MRELIKVLFCKCDNSNYQKAVERISDVKKLLEDKPKCITYKEIEIRIDY